MLPQTASVDERAQLFTNKMVSDFKMGTETVFLVVDCLFGATGK